MSSADLLNSKDSHSIYLVINQRIDVGHCTNLRLLELSDEEPALDSAVEWVGEARLPRLRTLSLVVATRDHSTEWLPDLAALDARISSPSFSGLTTLRIRCNAPHNSEVVDEKIQRDLPVTHGRRILQVVHWT